MTDCQKSIITLATNKDKYWDYAINMAYSVLLHNDLPIYIITNLQKSIPLNLINKVFILPIRKEHETLGIGAKLHLNQYIQTDCTLFIDSDCLIYQNLNKIWKTFKNMDVSVVGNIVESEKFCGREQAEIIFKKWNISQLIKFNGGVYFLKKSALTNQIFDFAQQIIPYYDLCKFQRIGNQLNEEGLLSIAMMKYDQNPIKDNGVFMTDLHTDRAPRLNVLYGKRVLRNYDSTFSRNRSWYSSPILYPMIIHFSGGRLTSFPYITQHLLIKLHFKFGLTKKVSSFIVYSIIKVPHQCYSFLKRLLIKK